MTKTKKINKKYIGEHHQFNRICFFSKIELLFFLQSFSASPLHHRQHWRVSCRHNHNSLMADLPKVDVVLVHQALQQQQPQFLTPEAQHYYFQEEIVFHSTNDQLFQYLSNRDGAEYTQKKKKTQTHNQQSHIVESR